MHQLFDMFTKSDLVKGRFADTLFSKMQIADEHVNDPNRVTYKYIVQPSDVNILGTLHGGATATIIDVLTSVSIAKLSMARTVSVNLTTQYYTPANVGDELRIQTYLNRVGKKLAFTQCEIFNKKNKLVAKGSHIKALLEDQLPKL